MAITIRALCAGALGALLAGAAAAADEWPARPIEDSVWASAGGGTDFTNRLITSAMEPHLGVTINVVNRTGGGGGVAMNHVWSKPHDGYWWLGASEAMQNIAVMGFHDTTTEDWRWYMVGGSPGSLAVPADSPYETLDEFIEAAKADPGSVKVSHCAIGCVWHLKALALGEAADVRFNNIPYEGSATAMVGALTGETDAVASSIQEQSEYIKAGKMRSLGMIEMEPFDFPDVGEIPAIGASYPGIAEMPARQWLGIAIPNDVPEDRVAKIDAAFEQAMASDKVQNTLKENFLSPMGQYGEDSQEVLRAMESAVSWKLYELEVAKISPEEFGIPKP